MVKYMEAGYRLRNRIGQLVSGIAIFCISFLFSGCETFQELNKQEFYKLAKTKVNEPGASWYYMGSDVDHDYLFYKSNVSPASSKVKVETGVFPFQSMRMYSPDERDWKKVPWSYIFLE